VHKSLEVKECLVKVKGRGGGGALNEQALVSLKLKKTVDAEGWCTKAVVIEGG